MTAVEITLIIVGIVFLLVSFLVQEKLSPKDIESITNLSENELKIIVEKQLKNANDQVEDAITDVVEDKTETTKRALEKETNEKIMAIDEYSNTVLESMNKTHNEILFLYSMLNDKHTELTDLATQLQQFSEHMKNTENEVLENLALAAQDVRQKVNETKPIDEYSNTVLESMNKTHNEILFLYSMLNDKHTELTDLATQLQQFSEHMKNTENEVLENLALAAQDVRQKVNETKPIDENEAILASLGTDGQEADQDQINHNDRILMLHQQGFSDVEIARELGLGLGEVKLVIGLFKGEETVEV